MQTAQVHIALALVSSLSNEEIEAFAMEFGKRYQDKLKPRKKEKKKLVDLPEADTLAVMLLEQHRSKRNSKASKLA